MDLWLKAGTLGWAVIRLAASVLVAVNLSTGAQGTSTQGGCTSTLLQTSGTWFQVRVTANVPTTGANIAIFLSQTDTASPSYQGNGTGTIFVGTGATFGPMLRQTSISAWNNHAGTGGSTWNLSNLGTSIRNPMYVYNNPFGPSADFDGINSWMNGATGVLVSQPCTVITKATFKTGTVANSAITDSDNTAFNARLIYSNNTAGTTNKVSMTGGAATPTTSFTLDVPFRAAAVMNGASSALLVNGFAKVSTSTAATGKGIAVGGASGVSALAKCSVFWLLLYTRALSENEIHTIYASMP